MAYRDLMELCKDYLDLPAEYVRDREIWKERKTEEKKSSAKLVSLRSDRVSGYWEKVKRIKVEGKELCLSFNKVEGCKEPGCKRAHKCAYMERGETDKVCGASHTKISHLEMHRK